MNYSSIIKIRNIEVSGTNVIERGICEKKSVAQLVNKFPPFVKLEYVQPSFLQLK
jgi:hypothetical protein